MPAFQFTKMLRNALARALVEKPETRHCRVIYSQIILRHLKPKLVNLFYQIKMISHRGHPMIRNHCEDCFRINLARRPKDLAQGLVIPVETLLNSLWFVTVHVQEHIHLAQVEKIELCFLISNVLLCLPQNFNVRRMMIGVDAVGNVLFSHLVEDRRCSADASTIVNVPFFDPVEISEQARADATF